MKKETSFRTSKVTPFLKTLNRTAYFPIQQKTIRGDADFILCTQGFFVWLELKTNTGKSDPLQIYKASCVTQTGGITLVAFPANWELVKSFLTLLDRGIYDKNVLRAIKQYSVSDGDAEANEPPDENARSVSRNAHRKGASSSK